MQTYLNPKAELEQLHEQGEEDSTVPPCGCCCTRRYQGKPSLQSQLQSALKELHRTLANAQANNDRESQINSLKSIGLIHCNLGEYAWGVKCLEQALQIAQVSRNRSSIATIFNCLGAAYRQTGQERKALKAYLQALEIFQETRDEHCVARTFNQLGSVYSCLGQLEQALFCSRQALSSFQRLGNSPIDESATLYTIG
jgi:tetratricopeptide (TPR) repeat protein